MSATFTKLSRLMSQGRKFESTTERTPVVYSFIVFQANPADSDGSSRLLKIPLSVDQSRMSKLLPSAGEKPLISATFSVPPRFRLPLARIASYCVGRLRLVPPSSILSVLVGARLMLPTVERFGERPGSNVPLKLTWLNVPTPLI